MRRRIIPCMALALGLAFTVTGCESVTEVFDDIVDAPANNDTQSSENGVRVTADDTMTIDRNLAVPVFKNPAGGATIVPQDSKVELDGTALSSDGGKISYQWYTNNVESNGGGTSVKGASDAVYSPDTSEVGIKYYYVVAKNEHQNSYMMGTGPVYEVNVIKKGTFTTDEFGGVRYLSDDGAYPSAMWVLIGNDTYYFNEEGYMSVGWVDLGGGKVYYFTEDGKLLRNAMTPDGYLVDENGVRQGDGPAVPAEGTDAAAEQPAEGQPAEGQPAEGQPAEGQPAEGQEGQPAEEQPAEQQPVEEQPAEEYVEQPVEE